MNSKYILLSFLVMGALVFSNQESFFKIDGMMCQNGCVYKVNSVVKSIEGVAEVEVDYDKGLLVVNYNPEKTNDDYIVEKLRNETTYVVKKESKKAIKKNLFKSILSRIITN